MSTEFDALTGTDPEIADIIRRETARQNTTVQLIASENFVSPAVLAAQGSVLTNKYSEGYPGKRYYGGNAVVDDAETLARDRLCELFGADHANVQPHSGANANMAAFLALLNPGDKVMGMRLDQGGHLTHGSPVNFSGRFYDFVAYGVDPESETLDYDEIRKLALDAQPKMIIAGATAYPRVIDFAAFREIADVCGALLLVDAAHIAGLIAGGAHPSPVPYADVVTMTTHKTLRGPRAGAIISRAEYGAAIDKAVFPGLQGGPLMHVDRGEGGRVPRGDAAVVLRLRGRDRHERGCARRPHWPTKASASCRAAPTTTSCSSTSDRSVSPGRWRRRRSTAPASPATRTPSRTTPRSRSSPAGCASAPPRSPRQGCASRRCARSRG